MFNIKKKFFKNGATIFFILGLIAAVMLFLRRGTDALIDSVLFAFFLGGVIYYVLSKIGFRKKWVKMAKKRVQKNVLIQIGNKVIKVSSKGLKKALHKTHKVGKLVREALSWVLKRLF